MGVTGLRSEDPATVGDFRLLGRLGAGGFGTVYLGLTAGGRRVAVKTVHRHIADHDGFRARFRREVEALRRAGGFFTASLVDADPAAPLPWLATEYVAGPDLGTVVARGGPLAPDAVWRLGAGLCEALATLHGAGLVHRDLKPSNVLLAEDGPRVIDFGIASLADATRLTVTHEAAGTPGYAAPEQLRGMRDVGPAADVFALTCLLVYAAGGRSPFRGGTLVEYIAHVLHEPPDLPDGLDAAFAALAEAGLALDPAARPALSDLAALCAERVGRAGPPRSFADLLAPAVRDLLTGAESQAATAVAVASAAVASAGRTGKAAAVRPRPWEWTAPERAGTEWVPLRGPALAHTGDGTGVVCVAAGGRLYGLDAVAGTVRWSVPTGRPRLAAGPVAAGDVFVVADDEGRISGYRAADGACRWTRQEKEASGVFESARLFVTDTPRHWVALRHTVRDPAPDTPDHAVATWEHVCLLDPATGEPVMTPLTSNDPGVTLWGTTLWAAHHRLFVQGYRFLEAVGLDTDAGARWRERAEASASLGERVFTWRRRWGLACRDGATGTVLWRSRRPRGANGAVSVDPERDVAAVVTTKGTWAFAARTGRLLWSAPAYGDRDTLSGTYTGAVDGVLWAVAGGVAFARDTARGELLWRAEAGQDVGTPRFAPERHGGLLFLYDGLRLRAVRPADGHEVWSAESVHEPAACDTQPHWTYGDLLYLRGPGGVRACHVPGLSPDGP
ncbi:PQQ-binding-like beta-propeller repeat protein [Streptomyces sp. NPDC090994]|uniref:protein kinase domain-containing protein n=1 Tax=Streptomyces sp. NPDC090994 TaxID=3365969 RepID=UPI0038270752